MTGSTRTLPSGWLGLLGAAGASLLLAPARADELHFADGTSMTDVTVAEAKTDRVKFKLGASMQERPAADVRRIVPTGDQSIGYGLKLFNEGGDPGRIESYFKRALERSDAAMKPYAQFFLAEHYEKQGDAAKAVEAYGLVANLDKTHFYAPVGLDRAAQLLLRANQAAQAEQRLARLASGEFGAAWKDRGQYGQARVLFAQGKHADARKVFADLERGASTPELKALAMCGEAHGALLAGQAEPAKRKFQQVLGEKKNKPEALGWAWRGLGELQRKGEPEEALLSLLRAFLLYPSNPEAAAAARAAAEVARDAKLGGEQRLQALASSPMGWGDYAGDQPTAELVRRTLQQVSAGLARKVAPGLANKATGPEKAELEFLAADALKAVAQASNDVNLLAEYEQLLKALQTKYPNHGRAALAGIDGFIAAKDRALAVLAQAKEEPDTTKQAKLMEEGRALFRDNIEPFKATIADLTKQAQVLIDKEVAGELTDPKQQEEKQELEYRRDLAEFLLAEAYYSYALTFAEKDEGRAKNLREAAKGYEHQIMNRGQFPNLLYFAYVGRIDSQLELGELEEAIRNAQELSYVEPPYLPEDPQQRQNIVNLTKDVCIRSFIAWIKALVRAGKFQEAVTAAAEIDERPYGRGWQDHSMGILFTFERAKALAGAGQGATASADLWAIVQKSMQAPEAEKIPGLNMTRLGAGACRALSELADVTGGEVYAPEVQYHVGIGYFLRQRQDLAISAFKGVLTAARTPEERAEWIPKAVEQIGKLLFEQERFLEAAIAYETVFSEFPDHEKATQAVNIALSASKRAVEQFGEDPNSRSTPMAGFYRRIEQVAAGDPTRGPQIIMNQAADSQRKEQWVAAAQKYLEVPAEVEVDGKKRQVPFFANAISNAGYCYAQAFKKEKKPEHLAQARECLARAAKLAKDRGDQDSQSLACFYLGELENDNERPQEALAALAPFDAELAQTTKYIVRARYQQAQAYLALGKPDAVEKAEAAWKQIENLSSDAFYGRFAYFLANELRRASGDKLKADPGAMDEARALRAKAGRYIKAWFDSSEKEGLKAAHYFWAGNLMFAGGLYRECVTLYTECLGRFQPPAPDGRPKTTDEIGSFDVARANLGYSLVMAGDAKKGLEVLGGLRDTLDVCARDGALLARGTFKGRELKGPFTIKVNQRDVKQQVWFTAAEVGGKEVLFFDTAPPRGADDEFRGVEGTAPKEYQPSDERVLKRSLQREYLVVDGIARATWALWLAEKDKGFLAKEVAAACNELRYVVRGLSETYWRSLAGSSQLEPVDHATRVWSADVLFLRIKLGQEKWREVMSDIVQMEKLGKLDGAPAPIKAELAEVKREAEARQ